MNRSELMELLLGAGHSATKSLEIMLDYQHGDKRTIKWIATLQQMKDDPVRFRKAQSSSRQR